MNSLLIITQYNVCILDFLQYAAVTAYGYVALRWSLCSLQSGWLRSSWQEAPVKQHVTMCGSLWSPSAASSWIITSEQGHLRVVLGPDWLDGPTGLFWNLLALVLSQTRAHKAAHDDDLYDFTALWQIQLLYDQHFSRPHMNWQGTCTWWRSQDPKRVLSSKTIPLEAWPPKDLHLTGSIGVTTSVFLFASLSSTATWRASLWPCSCSSARLTTGCWGPTPSTRCTASQARRCPPRATRPCTTTPRCWRSLCCRRTTCGPCEF